MTTRTVDFRRKCYVAKPSSITWHSFNLIDGEVVGFDMNDEVKLKEAFSLRLFFMNGERSMYVDQMSTDRREVLPLKFFISLSVLPTLPRYIALMQDVGTIFSHTPFPSRTTPALCALLPSLPPSLSYLESFFVLFVAPLPTRGRYDCLPIILEAYARGPSFPSEMSPVSGKTSRDYCELK